MLLPLALVLFAAPSPSAAAIAPRVEHAGFLHDARARLTAPNHLVFEAKLNWPATITRRSFVVEGLAADGSVLFTRNATALAGNSRAPHKRSVTASFELELPALAGVADLRVRLAP